MTKTPRNKVIPTVVRGSFTFRRSEDSTLIKVLHLDGKTPELMERTIQDLFKQDYPEYANDYILTSVFEQREIHNKRSSKRSPSGVRVIGKSRRTRK